MSENNPQFIGDIPENYDTYLAPLIFKSYAVDLANRIKLNTATNVLEIAAGTGMATRQLRDSLPKEVSIIATDVSKEMLNIAKTKFTPIENTHFQIADALELPFIAANFEAVVCQFGLMFFPDKLLSLREVHQVLKPSGRYYFNIWDSLADNHLAQIVDNTIVETLPDKTPSFFKVPYGYNNIDEITKLLLEAGFVNIEVSILPLASESKDALQVALGFTLGTPIRSQIEQSYPGLLPEIVTKVEQAVGESFGFKSISAKMQAIIFSAEAPV